MDNKNIEQHEIQAVVKDSSGEITGYKMENGEIFGKDKAVSMAKNGEIKSVLVSKSKKGEEFLKSTPDDNKNNNLDSLPVVDEKNLQ